MGQELELLRQILKWLWDNHGQPWRNWEEASPGSRLYSQLVGVCPPIGNDSEMESLLPSRDRLRVNFADYRKFLYLRPVLEGDAVLPVVIALFDFSRPTPEIRIQVAFFSLREAQPCAIGFRFESPEGEGRHNFYHAQAFRTFSTGLALPGAPEWLPQSTPAIPLDAGNPATLLLNTIVSIYGFETLRAASGAIWTAIVKHVQQTWLMKVQKAM